MPRIYTPPQPFETDPRPQIALAHVKSRQIAAIGHDAASRTLALQFKPKGLEQTAPVYHYPNWGSENHADFMAAASLGTFFGMFIKGREFKKFPAEPLPPEVAEE